MGGRHGASSGGRSVGEILASVAAGQGTAAAVAPTRSMFTVAAAATVGAGMAAAGATGTFPAIQVPDLPDFDASGSVAHIAPAAASNALPAAPVTGGAVSSGPAQPITSSTGTVMSGDLHQTDATEIAALSRAVRLAGPGGVAGAVESVLDAALKLPAKIGGVPIVGLAANQDAAEALRNAATKLGKPYIWGARGPNAFDCSGLMQWAYKQAGIKLPRSSTAQSQFGRAVTVKNLQPGDMVFYYTPVSHVGMYIGNGKILHASEPGKPVKISDVDAFPIHNARRVT